MSVILLFFLSEINLPHAMPGKPFQTITMVLEPRTHPSSLPNSITSRWMTRGCWNLRSIQCENFITSLLPLEVKSPDSNFAMAISKALPPSYDTLKTIAVANVTDTSTLTTETLVAQILCEEK